jgi:hypothetical protein
MFEEPTCPHADGFLAVFDSHFVCYLTQVIANGKIKADLPKIVE